MNLQLGAEAVPSPQRQELLVATLYGVAAAIESRKSLLPMEGSQTWLEESQILRVLKHLPHQQAFQVPNGKGGSEPMKLNWGTFRLPGILWKKNEHPQAEPRGQYLEVIETWIDRTLAELQKREDAGVFRRISLNAGPGQVGVSGVGLPARAAMEEALGEYVTTIQSIDPLEDTNYKFNKIDVFLNDKGEKPDHIRVYSKAALLKELIGRERRESVYKHKDLREEDAFRVTNAPSTCATSMRPFPSYTLEMPDLERGSGKPVPLFSLLSQQKNKKEEWKLGDFADQQFCFGIINHFIQSLEL